MASGATDTPSRRRIFACHPASHADETACAKAILSTLAHRAYRRPVTDADVSALLTFYQEGQREGGFETGIEVALRRLLMNPAFWCRFESDPPTIARNTAYRVNDVELASRLSFFLWSSIPDEELLDLANSGKLTRQPILEQQV
jgi:hypothetical protein